jgi:hypothetical protein
MQRKYYNKVLNKFETYLKDTFSLTSKWYYTILGIVFGQAVGILIGVLVGARFERSLGISLGISFGLFVGMIVGGYMDARAEAAGNLI